MVELVKCDHCDAMLKNTPRSIGSHIGNQHKDVSQALFREKVEFTMSCLECGELVANSNNVLARHLRKVHQMEWPSYYVKHNYGGTWPLCGCGCGEKLTWKKGGFARFIDGHGQRGENNPMFGRRGDKSPNSGKVRTDEAKEKYSRAARDRWQDPSDARREIMQSDKYRSNMSNAVKRAFRNCKIKQRQISGMIKWWSNNDELRAAYSRRACDLIEQGKIGPQAPFRAEWKHNPFTGRDEYMHSSWETRFLDQCISHGNPVTKKHGIRIQYIDPDGLERTYIPDFLTLDGKTLYEVKGYATPVDREKWKAATAWCLDHGAVLQVVVLD